jgi:hypothetical protein
MAETERKIVTPLTEGYVSKGGQNPPNASVARPPAPQGSGGQSMKVENANQTQRTTGKCGS